MIFRLSVSVLATVLGFPASALEIGDTEIRVDGGRGVITVTEQGGFKISIGGPGCTGGGEGRLLRGTDGSWAGVLRQDQRTCVVLGDGEEFYAKGDCLYFHGPSCAFAGRFEPSGPAMEDTDAGTLRFVELSVKKGFEGLDRPDRYRVQRELAAQGFYDARVDGAYGPSTRAALRSFGENQAAKGEYVGMALPSGVREILLDLINQDAKELAEAGRAATFVGDWACTAQRRLNFTGETYEIINTYDGSTLSAGALTPEGDVAPMASLQFLNFEGFRSLTIAEITPNTMLAHDPSDGSNMRCRRIGG